MKLIADSGSTKTDWRILGSDGSVAQARTAGLNPFYQTQAEMAEELQTVLRPQITQSIQQIFFYGAGCNSDDRNAIVSNALQGVFPQARIAVHSDMLAAARALCGNDPGIACILGTGSNSCLYDGIRIIQNIPPWGTWLGDEGSGAVMGRKLIVAYLNDEMPSPLMSAFTKRYPGLKETVLEYVYRRPYPNRYLGQFAKFLFHHQKDPYIYELVYESFKEFFLRKVMKYPGASELPIHFSGSVSFYFNTVLRKLAQDLKVQVKNIVESPIAGLTLFHQAEN